MYMLHYVTITSQGQISIPASLRKRFGFDKQKKAIIEADRDKIIVKPIPDILKLRGVFKTKKKIPYRKLRRLLDDAWASGEI